MELCLVPGSASKLKEFLKRDPRVNNQSTYVLDKGLPFIIADTLA
jgi:hypothetical protein